MESASYESPPLRISINGTSKPIPQWARFYIQLGRLIGSLPSAPPLLIGLVVPSRNYAASLLTTGYTLETLREPPSEEDLRKHFDHLKSLPKGAPVLFYTGASDRFLEDHRIYRGKLAGGSPDSIRVRIQSKNDLTRILSPDDAAALVNYDGEINSLPGHQRGYAINARIPFIRTLLPDRRPEVLLAHSRPLNLIVGSISQISRETEETCFIAGEEGEEGTLQDLLRVDRSSGRFDNVRTFLRKRSGYDSPESSGISSQLTVFDGSLVFRKWHSTFPDTHRVALLSRTDSEFEAALYEFDMRGSTSSDDLDFDRIPTLPHGVEIDGFYEG
jgi:hypothetical protein